MKNAFFKLTFPMTLATLLAHADQLNFTKNIPIESEIKLVNSNPLPIYDNKLEIGIGLFGLGFEEGVSYSRIKPDSMYFSFGTALHPRIVSVTAMAGYNFRLSEKDTLTPAAGLSYVPVFRPIFIIFGTIDHRVLPILKVGYEHAFNNIFSLGVDFASLISRDFSYTIGVPFTFHFGSEKRWEVQVTPYMIDGIYWMHHKNKITLNCALGYRF